MLTRRITAVAATTTVLLVLPATAYADTPSPGGIVDQTGLPAVASAVSTCRLAASGIYDAPLTASVDRKATGEIDFIWHSAAYGTVSSADACVTGILVKTKLTDTTTVPDCPTVVRSDEVSTSSNDPMTSLSTGNTDYEVKNAVDFRVAYFGGPTTTQSVDGATGDRVQTSDGSAPDLGEAAAKCYRLRSTVTEYDTAYYENSQHQFVPYCTQQISSEFVATAAGPERVGDPIVESVTC
jgi:hypothetical protein